MNGYLLIRWDKDDNERKRVRSFDYLSAVQEVCDGPVDGDIVSVYETLTDATGEVIKLNKCHDIVLSSVAKVEGELE